MKTNIIINIEFPAIHSWSTCGIPEVDFLRYPHRHIFKIECKKEVNHNDRDVEILMFKKQVFEYLHNNYYDTYSGMGNFQNKSCEMIAQELLQQFNLEYCKVMEDGENGAEVIA